MKRVWTGILALSFLWSCEQQAQKKISFKVAELPAKITPAKYASPAVKKLCEAAIERTKLRVRYHAAYVGLKYPMGDVPGNTGVCTDLIVRCYRTAFKVDLQQLVHEDMTKNFSAYPKNWGLKCPDKNIDHRRVPNLRCYFKRRGLSLAVSKKAEDYLPGDLVTWFVGNRPHIGIVSAGRTKDGKRPLIIHNIGRGPKQEDFLFSAKISGHYRFLPSVKH